MVPILSLFPLACALIILGIKRENIAWIQRVATLGALIPSTLSILLFAHYDSFKAGIQFETVIPWIPRLGISYHVGIDGISAAMILLHALCSLSAVMVSYSIRERVKEYYVFFMILIASMYGVFTSLDLFFLYFFYEMAVIPMYPLIGMWGSENREYATMKLTLYITAGAVIALVGILALYAASGVQSFDLVTLRNHLHSNALPLPFQVGCVPLILFGFGVIASLWPTHSWSPIGYAAAPSAVSMLHAGVLKKMGPYIIIRVALELMPRGSEQWLPLVATLCMANILYAGYCAMAQKDLKFVIGFSSVSHMGYVLLGLACLNSVGLNGAVFLMFSHGVMAALAFALIGFVYDQTHTRIIPELGGLAKQIPFIGTAFLMTVLASSGVPGFSNFVSEILIFFGAWKEFKLQTVVGVFGLIVTATYLLRAARGAFFGKLPPRWSRLSDAKTWMVKFPYAILLAGLLFFGFFPSVFLQRVSPAVEQVLKHAPQVNLSSELEP